MHGLEQAARELLDRNWREGNYRGREFAFSVPSPRSYPWQWYWDSCFHAIVRRRWEPERARRELETLLNASDDGFIGHTVFWGHRIDAARALRYNVSSRDDLMTHTIQPPVLAWAWSIVTGDPRGEPRLAAHHDWLREHRDLDGDGLLWLIQPDESGMDASPKFDHVWGRMAQGRPLFPLLIARNRRHGWEARRTRPVVCEVMTNVAWSLSEQALGRPSPTPVLVERLWHPRLGRFLDEVRGGRPRPRLVDTWDTLAPLALPDLPREIAEQLVERVLRAPGYAQARAAPVRRDRRPRLLRARDLVGQAPPLARAELGQQRVVRHARAAAPGPGRRGGRDGAAAGGGHGARGLSRVLRVAQRAGNGRARLRLVHADRRDAGPDGPVTVAVGIVGCGAVARHHVPALRAARGVKLVAAFDVDPAAAAATGARVAESLAELIEGVDLVAVCTPPEPARGGGCRRARSGRGVLVEKPLATTLDDADRIVAAAEGLLAATGFQLRCHRKLPAARRQISGVWGGPRPP